MVARLVIILPSKHSGGCLIIDHQGTQQTIKTDAFPLNELHLVAFYADCYHEVQKLTAGFTFKDCALWDHQITWTKASDAFEPFESEYEGYMGNYGNTMDRWYHRAAVVLWRKEDHYPILFSIYP